mgnify:CR=1 FL=1
MTIIEPDPLEPTTTPAPAEPDTAPIVPAKPKRDRSHRNTGNPPGRPRKDRTPAGTDPTEPAKPRGAPTARAKREQSYTRTLAKIGAAIYLVNPADGAVFLEGVPRTAKALAEVAQQNPRIGKVLDAGVNAGVWAELFAALTAIGAPIAVNHGKLPPVMGALLTGDVEFILAFAGAPAGNAPPPPAPPAEPSSTDPAPTLPDSFSAVS